MLAFRMMLPAILLLAVGGGALQGGLVPSTPGRIWALGQSSPGIKDPSLAREQAQTQARVNLARVAAALAGLALPTQKLSATLKGSEISSVDCKKVCVARAEAPLSGVEVKRGAQTETLEDTVSGAFAADRERAMHALDIALGKSPMPERKQGGKRRRSGPK